MKRYRIIKCICCIALFTCLPYIASAQEKASNNRTIGKLRVDPKIRYGRLDNGMIYYIRHNALPKERAEFYIVHNVGSMQEEDNQRGMAHFLEKMAFNGTKNFPTSRGIQDFIEKSGMRIGDNFSARTDFDETVYMLKNVPTNNDSLIDSCLLVLHDWSSFLLLDDKTVEKERKLIISEWRKDLTAQQRILEQQLPVMYQQSRYGQRLPTGLLAVIENFRKEQLAAYYKKWYRPNLQAIIIVGDVNAELMEQKIKEKFSDIPASEKVDDKELFLVPDNIVPIISIAKDKEMTNLNLQIFYKHEKIPMNLKGTFIDFYTNLTNSIIEIIMKERFTDIIRQHDSPFMAINASVGDYSVSKSKGAWSSVAVVKTNQIEQALKSLVLETEKVKNAGFNETEFKRAIENLLKTYESAFSERNNQENSKYAQAYIRHFTNGDYIPGIETEYDLIREVTQIIQLEDINNYVNSIFKENENFKNLVISLTGPDRDDISYPTETEMMSIVIDALKETIESNEEETVSKVLIPNPPLPGKIISEEQDSLFDALIYTLSNGAKVAVKRTQFKKDEILLTALSPGGKTMFKNPDDIWNIKGLNDAILCGGLGEFTAPELVKTLSGKQVSFNIGLSDYSEVVKGTTNSSDLKTLFEIVYLQFTEMRKDENAYSTFKNRITASLEDINSDPYENFNDSLRSILYGHNPRDLRLQPEDFNRMDYNRMIEMYNERFADASDFVFTFTGNIEIDTIKPLIEKYLASLPALNTKDEPDEKQLSPFSKGSIKKHFTKQLDRPQSVIHLMYTGELEYNLSNIIKAQLLSEILDLVLYEKIRQIEKTVNHVFTQVDIHEFPLGRASIQINLEANPKNISEMIKIITNEIERIAKDGPEQSYFNKCAGNILTNHKELVQENDYWLSKISTYYFSKLDTHTDYQKILNALTPDDIRNFTKELIEQGNFIELVMNPE